MIYWNSFADFLQMGRHAVYVWGAVGATAACLIVEPLLLQRHRRQVIAQLRRQLRAEQREQADAASGEHI